MKFPRLAALAACASAIFAPGCGSKAAAPTGTMTFLTYNVLAAPVSNDRIDALMEQLASSGADVIALQEVAPWFLERLDGEQWSAGYSRARSGPAGTAAGGLLILSRLPVKATQYQRLPGRAGRGVLVASLKGPRGHFKVATFHLESPLEDGKIRARQITAILKLVGPKGDAVLIGDFNLADGDEPETSLLAARAPGYTDAWRALMKDAPGFTWNIEKSTMARLTSFPGEKSRRLDRLLLRIAGWRPSEAVIVGNEPVKKGDPSLFPSDHFGLKVVVEKAP